MAKKTTIVLLRVRIVSNTHLHFQTHIYTFKHIFTFTYHTCCTYSTIFADVCAELKYWVYGEEPENDEQFRMQQLRVKMRTKSLYRLKISRDKMLGKKVHDTLQNDLLDKVGTFIIRFMQAKPHPFPRALDSQETFLKVRSTNTHLHFQTHICTFKHTFTLSNTYLHFLTHIYIFNKPYSNTDT